MIPTIRYAHLHLTQYAGGLSFTEGQIGGYLSMRAIIQIGCMFAYPSLLRSRWVGGGSAVRMYQLGMFIWPITVACYPFLNLLARTETGPRGWLFDTCMMAFFVVWGFGGYCWTSVIRSNI